MSGYPCCNSSPFHFCNPRPNNSEDFRKYRAVAPAYVLDETIYELMAKNPNNAEAINAAVDKLWDGEVYSFG